MRNIQLSSLMIITLLAAVTVFAADPIGTIVSVQGKAVATEQNGAVRNLELKSPVFQHDKIKTESGASLQIMFIDESVFAQGEMSEMTIDEYVYNPNKKEDNACTLNLGKGLFRTVTARITAMNPDRFKVKTRLTTIGIRGCEVAFTVTERGENVYVLGLPDGKSIVITLNPGVGTSALTTGGTVSKENAINIIQAGTMVSIEEDGGTTQRPITPQEAIDLIEEITVPGNSGDDPTGGGITDSQNQDENLDDLEEAQEEEEEDLTIGSTTEDEEEEETTEEKEETLTYTEQSVGMSWSWGVWEDSVGTPVEVQFFTEAPYMNLTPADTLAVVAAYPYPGGFSAIGMGESAAVVVDGTGSYLLSGQCEVMFDIGLDILNNNWSVSTLSPLTDGGARSLYYVIEGIIDGAGVLQGSFVDYSLQANGLHDLPTIQSSDINANLTGTSLGSPDGVTGHFNVIHSTGPTVQGGWAGSLMP